MSHKDDISIDVQDALSLLGCRVRDVVTGFSGIVETVGFDLYGCIQAIVKPGLDKDGAPMASCWFDIKRLVITCSESVISPPEFMVVAGGTIKSHAAEKPMR